MRASCPNLPPDRRSSHFICYGTIVHLQQKQRRDQGQSSISLSPVKSGLYRDSENREFLRAIANFEGADMRTKVATTFRPHRLICGLALMLALTPLTFGQNTQTMQPAANRPIQSIPNGSKLKFKGVVIAREGDTFRIRDRNRTD